MNSFDPESLENDLREALAVRTSAVGEGTEPISQDIQNLLEPHPDAVDQMVTASTLVQDCTPGSIADRGMSLAVFIEIAKRYAEGKPVGRSAFMGPNQALFLVTPVNDRAQGLLYGLMPIQHGTWSGTAEDEAEQAAKNPLNRHLELAASYGTQEYYCCLRAGQTAFALAHAVAGDYSDFAATCTDEDLFVEIRSDQPFDPSLSERLLYAYLFELSSSHGLALSPASRASTDDEPLYDEVDIGQLDRMRPLLLGAGLQEPLELYNAGVAIVDPALSVLRFTQVLEHIAQTVVRLQAHEAIRGKLMSARALAPDADFVSELQSLVLDQRQYQKDAEAIRAAMIRCCDAHELGVLAPPCLGKLRALTPRSSGKDLEGALSEFAEVLVATRNAEVHAKANFSAKGGECPSEELPPFANCAMLAAEQALRWYGALADADRVTRRP